MSFKPCALVGLLVPTENAIEGFRGLRTKFGPKSKKKMGSYCHNMKGSEAKWSNPQMVNLPKMRILLKCVSGAAENLRISNAYFFIAC